MNDSISIVTVDRENVHFLDLSDDMVAPTPLTRHRNVSLKS